MTPEEIAQAEAICKSYEEEGEATISVILLSRALDEIERLQKQISNPPETVPGKLYTMYCE